MNRRRFLIALAVIVPLAIFGAAKIAASWRPIAVGKILQPDKPLQLPYLAATPNVVFAGDEDGTVTRFDLPTQSRSKRGIEGVCQGNRALWRLRVAAKPQLEIIRPDQTRAYPLSPQMARKLEEAARSNLVDGGLFLSSVNVLDGPQQLQLLAGEQFCEWNQRTGQRQREFAYTEFNTGDYSALARDGKNIVEVILDGVDAYSTRDGHLIKRTLWPMSRIGIGQVSTFGAYFTFRANVLASQRWLVMDASNGRKLWSADWDVKRDIVFFSPDETMLVVARPSLNVWHLHDARTGTLLRTLAFVPDTQAGAFSPDGATLYSVADGVLYRQRAR